MKKICVSLVIIMSLIFNISAFAENDTQQGMMVGNTYISGEVKNYIEHNGIDLDTNDQIAIIDSISNNRATPVKALRIVHTDEETQSILLSYAEDENGNTVAADVPVEMSLTRGTAQMTYTHSSRAITVTGTIGCDASMTGFDTYFYPYLNQFSYTKNTSNNISVDYINTSFQTQGNLCTSSGIEIQKDYLYAINVYRTNPAPNTIYHTYKPLPSNQKILFLGGNRNSGVYLTFVVCVNGNVDARTYDMVIVS